MEINNAILITLSHPKEEIRNLYTEIGWAFWWFNKKTILYHHREGGGVPETQYIYLPEGVTKETHSIEAYLEKDSILVLKQNQQSMRAGDIVEPTEESGYKLHCGTGFYKDAVVISSEPFILTSREGDMKWQATIKKGDFKITGQIDGEILKNCIGRL